jgi:sialate O-acetylesterase
MVLEPLDSVEAGSPAWIPLSGKWKARVELAMDPNGIAGLGGGPPMPIGPGHPHQPGGLFAGMIAPLIPYPLAGVLWYQGEANAGRAEQYETLLPLLIRDWRERWDNPMPFYIVQLAGYQPFQPQPVESTWAELRDAQLNTYKRIPSTGLAVTIDVGNADDIHPTRKREVGTRLARWALSQLYARREIISSGPIYQQAHFNNGSAIVTFDLFGGELKVRGGGTPTGFTIAGNDRVFYPANAQIEGNTVIVWSPNVRQPAAVRYGWQDNPTDANLVNTEGLPASPFRTDRWPGLTADKR